MNQQADAPEVLNAADRAWMEKNIDKAFHPIIERYGRGLFVTVLSAGKAGVALGVLTEHTQFLTSRHVKQRQGQAITVLQTLFDQLVRKILADGGYSIELFQSCKQDVERTGSLAGDQTPSAAQGKIILPS